MKLKIKNALVSLSNKENIIFLLKTLKKFNIRIISSGGTYKYIKVGYELLSYLSTLDLKKC